MYIDLLKAQYYRDRKKLEEMAVFKQESKIRFIRLENDIIDKLQNRLSIRELLGRADIHEDIKDRCLRDKEEETKQRIEENLEKDRADIASQEKEELDSAKYSSADFSDYLYLLEKIYLLEEALLEEKVFPGEAYFELSNRDKSASQNLPD